MKIAALVKQIPKFQEMELGSDGRLIREGQLLEINPYCRRAISKGVELAHEHGTTCTVFTLGPPSAVDALKEAIAWGADEGVLITDPAFAGSDTLATSRALAAALETFGPFDLIFVGRNSVDADTGQVGPGVAELLGTSFLSGVKQMEVDDGIVRVTCEEDDGESTRSAPLPAVVSTAERLCAGCKVDRENWLEVADDLIRRVGPVEIGGGPYGQAGSPTTVGEVKIHRHVRDQRVLTGSIDDQLEEAVRLLGEKGVFSIDTVRHTNSVVAIPSGTLREIVVVIEPDREAVARELLGGANLLAQQVGASVCAFAASGTTVELLSSWGADRVVELAGIQPQIAENTATALTSWAGSAQPWAIFLPSTTWGREVASRSAVALGVGLTGDAVALEVEQRGINEEPQLIAWKPALSGHLVAAIRSSSTIQMATIRPGILPLVNPRSESHMPVDVFASLGTSLVEVVASSRNDDVEALSRARTVVGVGTGVLPHDYGLVRDLVEVIGAELAATRKVTDKGWLPRARQVGITGRSIAPQLYISIGISGKYNHIVGVQAAGTILSINSDPDALVFGVSDIGIVGDWQEIIPGFIKRLAEATD